MADYQKEIEKLSKLSIDELRELCAKVWSRETTKFALDNDTAFFSTTLFRLEFVEDMKIKTLATDGHKFFYNPAFLIAFPSAFGGIYHEVLHVICDHFGRQKKNDVILVDESGDMVTLWNIAVDLQVNYFVRQAQRVTNKELFPVKFWGVESSDKTTAEQLYDELYKKLQQKAKDGRGNSKDGKGGGAKGGFQFRVGSLKEFRGEGNGNYEGEHKDFDSEVESEVKSDLQRAMIMSKMMGKLPGSLATLINRLLEPHVDYRHLLGQFVLEQNRNDWRMNPPNKRRLRLQGMFLPRLKGETLICNVAIDTSGSTADAQEQFLGELSGICAVASDYRINLIYCDAAIQGVVEITKFDGIPPTKFTGGGTDFRPVFNYLKEHALEQYGLVYLTDGYGSFPEKDPGIRTLWVLTKDNADPPWGTKAYLLT